MGLLCLISAFLALLIGVCVAETVTLRDSARGLSPYVDTRGGAYGRRSLRLPAISGAEDDESDIHLLDITLVASVDGRFHALNRTSGQKLWSMSTPSAFSEGAPSSLAPLVRTKHVEFDPDVTDDDSADQELYVIEPQSGDIYVMATPTSPLQRLSLSMAQLVDMSPSSFASDNDRRFFVGRKETSLLSIELETGKVKAINWECPWDPFEDLNEDRNVDVDLDELEDVHHRNIKSTSTQVLIGRTDYHLSIQRTRPISSSGRKPPVQNLSFSSYGPNNEDHAMQSLYRRTADSVYINSFPDGRIISLKASNADGPENTIQKDSQALWALNFDDPIVAVFDVFTSPGRDQPFVLLQPRLPLDNSRVDGLMRMDAAYVGLVKETSSLFVMSPDRYPLVVFDDTRRVPGMRLIDSGYSDGDDLPIDLDSVTKVRKLRELCRNGPFDWRCMTGKRELDSSDIPRQLGGVPSVFPLHDSEMGVISAVEQSDSVAPRLVHSKDNSSLTSPWTWNDKEIGSRVATLFALDATGQSLFSAASILVAVLLWVTWFVWTKAIRRRSPDKVVESRVPVASVSSSLQLPSHHDTDSLTVDASQGSAHNLTGEPSSQIVLQPAQTSHALGPDVEIASEETGTLPQFAAAVQSGSVIDLNQDAADGEDSEHEGEPGGSPKKRKTPRRRRGKKGRGTAPANALAEDEPGEKVQLDNNVDIGHATAENDPGALPPPQLALSSSTSPPPSLVLSDAILGFGSHGTVVYKGSLQGRAVAVKRLLQDFVTLASREVSLLQESDDHPNVIRYYYQESHGNFLYIALELCPASLADVIETPDQFSEISAAFEPKRALKQIASGLRHLHSLKIIHRDIKPQNILISNSRKGAGKDGGHRMLISDFGLCKKLDVDQTSFLPTAHGAMAAGTVGWRAPEILRGEVKLDESMADDGSQSSRGSVGGGPGGTPLAKPTRLTKSVDIFALGCLFYYTLTNGNHPFGDRFEREMNIFKNAKNLDGLRQFEEEGSEAIDLISGMLDPEASQRPDTTTCLLHPFFWDSGRRLNFLQDASDRFEIMCRDPRDAMLIILEDGASAIVGNDWHSRLDKIFIENLGKFRKYDGKSVQDLLRALRNKKNHYQDLPENVKRHLGPMPEGFLFYFTRRFPRLFLHVHSVISATSLRHESMFKTYYELSD